MIKWIKNWWKNLLCEALIEAVEKDDLKMFKSWLYKAGTDVNYVNKDGKSALILAAKYGRIEMVEKLLLCGVNLNHVDERGNDSLILSVKNNHVRIVEILIIAGANVNHVNKDDKTALMYAQNGNFQDIENLLKNELEKIYYQEYAKSLDVDLYKTFKIPQKLNSSQIDYQNNKNEIPTLQQICFNFVEK